MKVFLTSGFEGMPNVAGAVHEHLMNNGLDVWYDYPIYRGGNSPALAEQLQSSMTNLTLS
jgi:hypothetical protein